MAEVKVSQNWSCFHTRWRHRQTGLQEQYKMFPVKSHDDFSRPLVEISVVRTFVETVSFDRVRLSVECHGDGMAELCHNCHQVCNDCSHRKSGVPSLSLFRGGHAFTVLSA